MDPELSGDFNTVMEWAKKYKTIQVKTNADTPHDADVASKFGAEGIGLCRTEHMFFDEARIKAVREMIVAKEIEGRKKIQKRPQPSVAKRTARGDKRRCTGTTLTAGA